ncbi:hypothetical protein NFI96_018883 [Prochilodus magdalenae]|nr:hypothetical protein NFI96_018883 [Prochilodus magdalenae]
MKMSADGSFPLVRSLWKSPAVLRRQFRRDHVLSHGDPLFRLHYLGTEKMYSLDMEQAEKAIGCLLEKSPTVSSLGKDHALVVRQRYVEVKEVSTGRQLTKTFLRDIACCTTNTARPNIFLYICRQPGQVQLQCRVFWCRRPERARDITACLALSFQRALRDWQEGEGTAKDGQPIKEHEQKNSGRSSGSGRESSSTPKTDPARLTSLSRRISSFFLMLPLQHTTA